MSNHPTIPSGIANSPLQAMRRLRLVAESYMSDSVSLDSKHIAVEVLRDLRHTILTDGAEWFVFINQGNLNHRLHDINSIEEIWEYAHSVAQLRMKRDAEIVHRYLLERDTA